MRAAVEGWDYPWSAEAWVLANLFDQWTAKDAPPYPRPSDKALRPGRPPDMPQEAVRAALAARGH